MPKIQAAEDFHLSYSVFFNRSRQTSKSPSYVNQALIERLAQEVVLLMHRLPETSKSYRVFKAGICYLTQKIKHQFGSEVLHNRSQENSNLLFKLSKIHFLPFESQTISWNIRPLPLFRYINFKNIQIRRGLLQRSKYSLKDSNFHLNCLETGGRSVSEPVNNVRYVRPSLKFHIRIVGLQKKPKKKPV